MDIDFHKIFESMHNLGQKEIDKIILVLIKKNNNDYLDTYMNMLGRIYTDDKKLYDRIKKAFNKHSSLYIRDEIKQFISMFKKFNDGELKNKIIEMYKCEKNNVLEEILRFCGGDQECDRIDKIYCSLSQQFRMIDNKKEIYEWEKLSCGDLKKKIADTILGSGWTSSGSHWMFLREYYPLIEDNILQEKVNKALVELADVSLHTDKTLDVCGRALYICAKLKFSESKRLIQKGLDFVKSAKNNEDVNVVQFLHWIIDAKHEGHI